MQRNTRNKPDSVNNSSLVFEKSALVQKDKQPPRKHAKRKLNLNMAIRPVEGEMETITRVPVTNELRQTSVFLGVFSHITNKATAL